MDDKTLIVKEVFGIPEWYLLSEKEENKLFKYIINTRNEDEARLFRAMDCSAFCEEQFCYFCATYWGDIQGQCVSCTQSIARE